MVPLRHFEIEWPKEGPYQYRYVGPGHIHFLRVVQIYVGFHCRLIRLNISAPFSHGAKVTPNLTSQLLASQGASGLS
jgi:hypothetical protein